MKIKHLLVSPYEFTYAHGYRRQGALIKIENDEGEQARGDLAPLPERSKESLAEALEQLKKHHFLLTSLEWDKNTFLEELAALSLFPSVSFALESALFSLFQGDISYSLETAALLMGNSVEDILQLAALRKKEGFTCAKLKISNLPPQEAFTVVDALKGLFKLRIDANSRWSLRESIRFFSQFPLDTFEYIEDPASSLEELHHFPFPLAVEEPLSRGVSLSLLENIPTIKAITYKPTVQGGCLVGQRYKQWTDSRGIALVLSSSLESAVGHFHLVATAGRLGLNSPLGIGTYPYLNQCSPHYKLQFNHGKATT